MNENSIRVKRLSVKNTETHLNGDKWQIERQTDRLIDGQTDNSAILVTVVFCRFCFYSRKTCLPQFYKRRGHVQRTGQSERGNIINDFRNPINWEERKS